MQCPSCKQDNLLEARFCMGCGSALKRACPSCGAEAPAEARFCMSCGASLAAVPPPVGADVSSAPAPIVSIGEGSGDPTPTESAPPAATPHPTSFVGGRYVVKKFLGEGGKKRVFLAHDSQLDRDVAFALIKTDGLDADGRRRVQREGQAMGRLGDHPHIVTVHDIGETEGQPYIVSQFMAGGDVERLIHEAPDHRLPLERTMELALQVCRGLEYAHEKGFVHRDLKPGNVWLTQDGVAMIGDFGLAHAIDRSRLTAAGMMVGTVSYMPPEQALGGKVDFPSDLYSLGAMIYEMVAGRPPFIGDDTIAIIGQHINTPPVAPSWHNPRCPVGLEELILRLLAKRPDDRIQTATEVLAILNAIDVGAIQESPAGANPLDRLARGTFIGRATEMTVGKSLVEDAFSGRVNFLLLAGELGIGKTRLAEEIGTYASLRGATVLWGASARDTGAPPYWPWVQALRGYVRTQEADRLRSELGSAGPEVAKVVSEIRERLPELPQPTPGDPAQERFRLFDAIATFLRNAGADKPLVIVLDNVHFADQPTLLLAQFLLQEAGDARVLIIGTYREVEQGRHNPIAQLLAEMTQERRFRRMPLTGLSREETGRLMEAIAGTAPSPALLERVYSVTEGVPLYVEEMVRYLAQEGRLDALPSSMRIPQSLRELVGQRLDRLSPELNEVLTMAGLVGREFDFSVLKELTGQPVGARSPRPDGSGDPTPTGSASGGDDWLLELLEEGVAAKIIAESEGVLGRYQFVHGLTRQVLTGELTTTRRVRLHGRVGLALERVYGIDVSVRPEALEGPVEGQARSAPVHGSTSSPRTGPEARAEKYAAELAFHFLQAAAMSDAQEKAVRYSVLAARAAEATHAYEDVVKHYEDAYAIIADTGQSLARIRWPYFVAWPRPSATLIASPRASATSAAPCA